MQDTRNEFAVRTDSGYIEIHEFSEGGYEYNVIDEDYQIIDGGVYDDDSISIDEAFKLILRDFVGYTGSTEEVEDYDEFMDAVRDADDDAFWINLRKAGF